MAIERLFQIARQVLAHFVLPHNARAPFLGAEYSAYLTNSTDKIIIEVRSKYMSFNVL